MFDEHKIILFYRIIFLADTSYCHDRKMSYLNDKVTLVKQSPLFPNYFVLFLILYNIKN